MAGEDPPRVLSVYGGDGSVSRMAQLALEFDVPLMPLPGGTFNHFSRTAGIETVDLAIDALQAGSGIAASVAELTAGGRTTTVINSASIGIYPDGRYTLTCRIVPRALRVYAPAPSREQDVLDNTPD